MFHVMQHKLQQKKKLPWKTRGAATKWSCELIRKFIHDSYILTTTDTPVKESEEVIVRLSLSVKDT